MSWLDVCIVLMLLLAFHATMVGLFKVDVVKKLDALKLFKVHLLYLSALLAIRVIINRNLSMGVVSAWLASKWVHIVPLLLAV